MGNFSSQKYSGHMKKKFFFIAALFLSPIAWNDLAVTPPIIQFENDDKFSEITIKNTNKSPRIFDVSVQQWLQKNGLDEYEKTDDIIAMPITVIVEPESEKIIRIISKNKPKEAAQNSYRLFIRENPYKAAEKTTQGVAFKFLYRIVVPIFSYGKNHTSTEKLSWSAVQDSKSEKIKVTLNNLGTKATLLNGIGIKGISNTNFSQARYVLPGAFYVWEFPIKQKKSFNKVDLQLKINEKPAEISIDLIKS